MKLSHQFKSGNGGGKRISDQVGAGSEDWDEKANALIRKEVRERAKVSVEDMLVGRGKSKKNTTTMSRVSGKYANTSPVPISAEDKLMAQRRDEDNSREVQKQTRPRGIFDGLVIYINGSTYPLISDHKLKHVLAENGARLSIHLGRRQVTHVILGKPAAVNAGAGGGLAGGKIDKEIRRIGGCGVKYVGVEW
jgi:hypothetical protein